MVAVAALAAMESRAAEDGLKEALEEVLTVVVGRARL